MWLKSAKYPRKEHIFMYQPNLLLLHVEPQASNFFKIKF